jgi:GTP cyclohydrolase II
MSQDPPGHIRLTSHSAGGKPHRFPIHWGAETARARGPVIGSITARTHRNVIGAHGGAYSIYRALAVSAGALNPATRADLKDTGPLIEIGPNESWSASERIVSLDPWGHRVTEDFKAEIADGIDIRPTIAITKARLTLPEVREALELGRLVEDGLMVRAGGEVSVIKAAIDPVWYLPGRRRASASPRAYCGVPCSNRPEACIRSWSRAATSMCSYRRSAAPRCTFLAIRGDPRSGAPPDLPVHDECNGSDVFGSDICTCRPYLTHGVEECIREAQAGGAGLIVYNRKEGRALGEVTKFLVIMRASASLGGDQAATYFARTECVAGVQDARFQQLMPDTLQWLGVTRIDRLVSMSNLKYDALVGRRNRRSANGSPFRRSWCRKDAQVEIEAKKAAGYFTPERSRRQSCVLWWDVTSRTTERPWTVPRSNDAPGCCYPPRPCAMAPIAY